MRWNLFRSGGGWGEVKNCPNIGSSLAISSFFSPTPLPNISLFSNWTTLNESTWEISGAPPTWQTHTHRLFESKGFATATCFCRNGNEHGAHKCMLDKWTDRWEELVQTQAKAHGPLQTPQPSIRLRPLRHPGDVRRPGASAQALWGPRRTFLPLLVDVVGRQGRFLKCSCGLPVPDGFMQSIPSPTPNSSLDLALFNSFIEMQFTHWRVYSSEVFSIFTGLCNHQPQSIQNIFITPERNPLPTPYYSQTLQPEATTKPLSVSTNLPVLDISSKWNHIPRGLLCLASFT